MKNFQRKVDPRSVLKVLPEERQSEILEFCAGHTLTKTIQWLSASGIKTNLASLSKWREWFLLCREMEDNGATVEAVMAEGKARGWLKSDKEVRLFGQIFFNRLALKRRDPKIWHLMQQINLKQRDQQLKEKQIALHARRIAALEEKVADAKAKIKEAQSAYSHDGSVPLEVFDKFAEDLNLL